MNDELPRGPVERIVSLQRDEPPSLSAFPCIEQRAAHNRLVGRGRVRRECGSTPHDSVRSGNNPAVTPARQMARAARPLNAQAESCRGAHMQANTAISRPATAQGNTADSQGSA